MTVQVFHSDCVAWLRDHAAAIAAGEAEAFDSCVTDPPYHLTSIVRRFGKPGSAEAKVGATGAYARASRGFMGKEWDGGDVAIDPETWRAVFDCLKAGAHLIAFSGTRTYHRMACAIEDAGFEIRDQLAWCYGSGFPKSHDISKAIDRMAGTEREVISKGAPVKRMIPGAEQNKSGWLKDSGREFVPTETMPATDEAREWEGWGTALKPAWEPICLARKPVSEKSVAANVMTHGTGAINLDGCRVGASDGYHERDVRQTGDHFSIGSGKQVRDTRFKPADAGRFPANLCHDGSEEATAGFPGQSGGSAQGSASGGIWQPSTGKPAGPTHGDSGSAARFFYSAKAGPLDRIGTTHATVKPVDLMRWLCRLVTPPGGTILEPFAGSGTTGIAAMAEGFGCAMIEMEADHVADIERKLAYLRGEGAVSFIEHDRQRDKRKGEAADDAAGPLFEGLGQ